MTLTPQQMEALVREGEGLDAGVAAHEQAAAEGNLDDKGQIIAPPDPVDLTEQKAAEWMIVPQTLAWAITAALPETAPAYTPEKCMELARAFVPVAEKYGWNGPGESPELSLLLCSAMFCAPAYIAVKHRQAAAKQKKDESPKRAEGEPLIKPINGTEA